jgi:hypothetical protein
VQLVADRDGFDSMSAAQRQNAQKRALRATVILVRDALGDIGSETD